MALLAAAAALLLLLLLHGAAGQQPFENNLQFDCYHTNASSVLGYACDAAGATPSCLSYAVFRSSPPLYQSPLAVATLLAANSTDITAANPGIASDFTPVPAGQLLLVPLPCSCSGGFYQHNASYTIKFTGETYQTMANDTYQGLSACQAVMAQNPQYPSTGLLKDDKILIPLRCACPTPAQASNGIRFLLTYIITWGDDVPTIASRFGVDAQSVRDANELTDKSTIFPFNTLLIPLKKTITSADISSPVSPPPPPPPAAPAAGKINAVKVGVGVAAGAVAAACLIAGFTWCWCKNRRGGRGDHDSGGVTEDLYKKPAAAAPVVLDITGTVDSLAVYKYEELESATAGFAEEYRIAGSSVYRGTINGDPAAIKRLVGVADASPEIGLLNKISHSCIVRLSGYCVHAGDTYLVYEYVDNGSLADWLHGKNGSAAFGWRQRMQVAHDVAAGINYLHSYTSPPYVHRNIKSSNILLDGEFRAKLSNFALSRALGGLDSRLTLTPNVVGTRGYLPPEYLTHGLISPQLDVYAFGVVLLELLSGKEAVSITDDEKARTVLLAESAEKLLAGEDGRGELRGFMDERLGDEYPFETALSAAQLALRCVARDPAARPAMADALAALAAALEYGGDSAPVLLGR